MRFTCFCEFILVTKCTVSGHKIERFYESPLSNLNEDGWFHYETFAIDFKVLNYLKPNGKQNS